MRRLLSFLLSFMTVVSCSNVVDDAIITDYRGGRKAAVSLTFDDGILDHYTMVVPKLDSLGLKGTFWVNGKFIGQEDDYAPRLTWEMCREMTCSGHEISNHSWSHPALPDLSEEEIRQEIKRNDDAIEEAIAKRPITFCYPFNAWNDAVSALAWEGRVGVRESQEPIGIAETHSTPESLSAWLNDIVTEGTWGVTMCHSLLYGWDNWMGQERILWDFLARLAAMQDEVWVDTFAAVASYRQEREHCSIEVRRQGKGITILPQCDLDPSLYREKLTARVALDGNTYLFDFDPLGGKQYFDIPKTIAILGDSYSTFYGYIPDGQPSWYSRETTEEYSDVHDVRNTWWWKVADEGGFNLGVNDSYSGATVSYYGYNQEDYTNCSFITRASRLGNPDIILVFGAINDSWTGVTMGDYVYEDLGKADLYTFRPAMALLFDTLNQHYPRAKIYFVLSDELREEINESVHTVCAHYGVPCIDLQGIEKRAGHPTARGMDSLAEQILPIIR